MKQYGFPLLALLLVACIPNQRPESGDKILLSVIRGKLFGLLMEGSTYAVSPDGSGETSTNLPPDLRRGPKWSPDGQWVAFIDWELGKGTLYVMRSDGRRRVEIRLPQKDIRNPTWSPDRSYIAYVAYDDLPARIYIINVECLRRGEECQPMPMFLAEGHFPDWSPNGKRIVYKKSYTLSDPADRTSHIYAISVDGSEQAVDMTPNLEDCSYPRWSPDGQKIAFDCDKVIYVINTGGSRQTALTEPGSAPTWSPDGSKIAFVSTRDGLGKCLIPVGDGGCIYSNSVFLMNADGSNITRLSKRNDEYVSWYTWLPAAER